MSFFVKFSPDSEFLLKNLRLLTFRKVNCTGDNDSYRLTTEAVKPVGEVNSLSKQK